VHSAIGETRNYRGQLYKCVDAFPHVTRDGRDVMLLVIRSRCADCYQTFEITETSNNFRRRSLLRRCESCRKPGVPVGPVRRRREASNQLSPIQEQMWQVLVDMAGEQRHQVSSNARGWVRVKDWMKALVERGVLGRSDMAVNGPYHRMRRELIRKGRIEICGPAVRAS
jgi:hypothetical protein